MISFLRELTALPLKLLFWICHFLRVPAKCKMAELVWKVGREFAWANTWMMLVCRQQGLDSAQQLAEQLLERHRDARIAHQIGMMVYLIQKDPAAAVTWINKAESMNCRYLEELLHLKLLLADHIHVYNTDRIVDEILARNDLPMEYSRTARLVQAEMQIRRGQWQNADNILDRMLVIESLPLLHIYKWITSLAMGRAKQAEENLCMASKGLNSLQLLFYKALGWFYLGQQDTAREFLTQAVKSGLDIRDIALSEPQLAQLVTAPAAGAPSEPAGGQS